MAEHGPEPGTILNTSGEETVPRQAATVLVLRGGDQRLEVLLAQRTPKARFMGGAWVFPGGAVDAHEGEGDASHRAAAVREVHEEAGIALPDPAALVPFARWITPPEITVRFDTYFFLAAAPDGQEAQPDGQEIVDARWFEPARALSGHANQAFDVPEGIVFVEIDKDTGKLATPACPNVFREAFRAGTEPTELCPIHFF